MDKTFKKSTLPLLLAGAACLFILVPALTGLFTDGAESQTPNPSDLETVLSDISGVGNVKIYRHGEEKEGRGGILMPLDGYFGASSGSEEDTPSGGILVVAEGAGDPRVRAELVRILSGVLQLPEHRIVVVEMKKEGEEG